MGQQTSHLQTNFYLNVSSFSFYAISSFKHRAVFLLSNSHRLFHHYSHSHHLSRTYYLTQIECAAKQNTFKYHRIIRKSFGYRTSMIIFLFEIVGYCLDYCFVLFQIEQIIYIYNDYRVVNLGIIIALLILYHLVSHIKKEILIFLRKIIAMIYLIFPLLLIGLAILNPRSIKISLTENFLILSKNYLIQGVVIVLAGYKYNKELLDLASLSSEQSVEKISSLSFKSRLFEVASSVAFGILYFLQYGEKSTVKEQPPKLLIAFQLFSQAGWGVKTVILKSDLVTSSTNNFNVRAFE